MQDALSDPLQVNICDLVRVAVCDPVHVAACNLVHVALCNIKFNVMLLDETYCMLLHVT